ncbi:hypothetical protein [Paenalkalicoccus suaedae]|nr:hypothetical protein [Paenalkalicoccus suaedae]
MNNNCNSSNENASLKLAIIGAFIATIGDAISTYAAVLALDESVASDQEQAVQMQAIQQQIDELKNAQFAPMKNHQDQQMLQMQQEIEQLKMAISQKNPYDNK